MNDEDLKARFEDWAKKYNRTYRDEEEKAMRFEVFKDKIKWIESLPPSRGDILRPLNCFADIKFEEFHPHSCIIEIDDPETREYNKKLDEWLAKKDKGLFFFCNYIHDALASLNHLWLYPFYCGCQIGPIGSNFQRRSCYTYFYGSDLHLLLICFVDNSNINGIYFIAIHWAFLSAKC
jgi:hypothetical protein